MMSLQISQESKACFIDKEDIFPLVFLSLYYGLYFFFITFLFFIKNGITGNEEWIIFILGWLLVPFLTIITIFLNQFIKNRFFRNDTIFYPFIIFFNSLYFSIAVWLLRFYNIPFQRCPTGDCLTTLLSAQVPSFETGKFLSFPAPHSLYLLLALFFPFYNLVLIFIARTLQFSSWKEGLSKYLPKIFYSLIPLLIASGAINYSGIKITNFKLAIISSWLAIVCFFHKKMLNFTIPKKWMWSLHIVLIITIIYLIFDPVFTPNHPHQNPVLAPINDLMFGKSLLVDTNCQYGVLLIYFLRFLFLIIPFSYQGLTLISMILFIFEYSILYVLLRYVLKSPLFAVATLFIIMETNFFATWGGEIVSYPCLGPLRFGIPYLLLLIVLVRSHFSKFQRMCLCMERLLVAIASIWSFETFVYTIAVYGVIILYENYLHQQKFKSYIIKILKQFGILVMYIAVAYFFMSLSIYLRSHTVPDWRQYYDYIFLYSAGGWGGMSIAPWSPWIFLLAIPFISLLAILYSVGKYKTFLTAKNSFPTQQRRDDERSEEFSCQAIAVNDSAKIELMLIAAMSCMGIAQFTYFVGRSHPNNLFHVSVPGLFVAAYGMVRVTRAIQKEIQWFYPTFIYCCYLAIFYLFLSLAPTARNKLVHRLPQYKHIQKNFTKSPTLPLTQEALYLVNKYAKNEKRIGLFLETGTTTETLVLSRKVHLYPIGYPEQESICPSARLRAINFQHPWKEGDIIFVSKDVNHVNEEIVKKLQSEFKFVFLEGTPQQIYAVQLKKLPGM